MDSGNLSGIVQSGIVEVNGQLYHLEITGEVEVIPGPISLIRQLCQARIRDGQPVDPRDVLAIMEEAGV